MAPKISVIFDSDLKNPSCSHGPTLLFERVLESGASKQYFACSAYRDRKKCSFYQPTDIKVNRDFSDKSVGAEHLPDITSCQKRLKEISSPNRSYCQTCSVLFAKGKDVTTHKTHKVFTNITDQQMKFPSKILVPKSSSKEEAQFFFTERTSHALCTIIQKAGATHVLCIGAPRIFEHLRAHEFNMESFFMDIDARYYSFIPSLSFAHYNMFNHHFFSGEKEYTSFLKGSDKLAIVLDPPFGGRIDVLKQSVTRITEEWEKYKQDKGEERVDVFLIYPYFNEPKVKENLPDYNMVDYKIDYDNHKSFKAGGNQGSAVRLFTNVDLKKVVLPEDEGYQLCSICEIYVSKENKHCFKCQACTSKNGTTYTHCKKCKKCVKSSWHHCNKCGQCALPVHPPCHQVKERGRKRKRNFADEEESVTPTPAQGKPQKKKKKFRK